MFRFPVAAAPWISPPAGLFAANVRAVVTTRAGITSEPPYDGFNLALHVGDDPDTVCANRAELQQALGLARQPAWLEQVHGTDVVDAATVDTSAIAPRADAAFTRAPGVACVVMTADCLPVVLAAADGSVVGVAHAGWRGLCNGVVEALAAGMQAGELVAWLGPCIGPDAYETGPEVREAFLARDPGAGAAFVPVVRADGTPGFRCDLYALARRRLAALGVTRIAGGDRCTFSEPATFYSFRRQPVTGRFATLVWRD